MDDDAAFDILNEYEPGFSLKQRKEVLWDLVIVYPDGLVDEILDIDGRVPGTFDISASQARFRMGGSIISLDFVDTVEHMRRGVIVKGQTSLRSMGSQNLLFGPDQISAPHDNATQCRRGPGGLRSAENTQSI